MNDSIIKAEGVELMGQSQLGQSPEVGPIPGAIFPDEGFTIFEVQTGVPGTDAATAALYPVFYVATVKCFLIEAKLRHDVNSTSGTVDIEKLVDTTAKGSGVSMLASTFSTASGARTTISKKPTLTLANAQLKPGDAVALKAGGTLTNCVDIVVTCLFGILNRDLPVSLNV